MSNGTLKRYVVEYVDNSAEIEDKKPHYQDIRGHSKMHAQEIFYRKYRNYNLFVTDIYEPVRVLA